MKVSQEDMKKDKPTQAEYEICTLCDGEGRVESFRDPELEPLNACGYCSALGWVPILPPVPAPLLTEEAALYWCRIAEASVQFGKIGSGRVTIRVEYHVADRASGPDQLQMMAVSGFSFLSAVNTMREYLNKLFPPGEED
jgi:hypothetical protein